MNDKLKTLWGKISESRFKHLYIILAITAIAIVPLSFIAGWVYLVQMLFYFSPVLAFLLAILCFVTTTYVLVAIIIHFLFIDKEN